MATGTRAGSDTFPAGLFTRERLPILAALTAITLLAWAYLSLFAHQMTAGASAMSAAGAMAAMPGMTMGFDPWTAAYFTLTFAMWWVMMIGMMIPSATPMILIYDRISRGARARGTRTVPTFVFAGAYLAVWGAFALAATLAQLTLESVALMLPMQRMADPLLGGLVFVTAGLFQFTPLKNACLRNCRSPLSFIMGHWRDGTAGALTLGIRHGLYCLGCCWFLMALLFVGGVMNLLWVAIIAAYVLAEKLFPGGVWIARLGGAALVAFGVYLIATVP